MPDQTNVIRSFTDEEIEFLFTYHPPTPEQARRYEVVNQAFQRCAKDIVDLMPDGPGKTVAMRKLGEARMSVNMAIALEGRF